jgi:type IX secretion system PorP/SprF family membrane protein
MKRIILSAALLIITSLSAMAQQDPLISQYMFNHLLVNPAYAGSKDYAMVTALYRNQWVKLEGAPKTFLASIHGPVFKSRKVGLGFTISNDKIGLINRTNIMGDYAYHIPINSKLKLGLGAKAGVYYQTNDLSKAILTDNVVDPIYSQGQVNKITPEVGVGAYLYSKKFYLGLSVPHILSYDDSRPVSFSNKGYNYVRHYWLTSGVAIEASEDFVIRPSMMFRYSKNAPAQLDLNCNFLIKKLLWLGATYRTGDSEAGPSESIIGIIEFQITKQFRLGYSYDFTSTELKNYSNGSHEITLGYDFGYDILKLKSPRYF